MQIAVLTLAAIIVAALIALMAWCVYQHRRRAEALTGLATTLQDIDLFGEAKPELEFEATGPVADIAEATRQLLARVDKYKDRLLAQDRRIRRLLGNVTDVLYQTDADLRLTWVSASVERVLGYSAKELRGRRIDDFLLQESSRMALLLRSDTSSHPVRVYCRDGSVAWVLLSARRLQDADGRFIGVEGAFRDGTELVKAEQALFMERERAQVTLASIGDSVVTTTIDGTVDYMNASAQALIGTGCMHHKPHAFDDVCHLHDGETGEPITGLIASCIESGRDIQLHSEATLHNRRKQQEFAVRINVSPIRDSRKTIIGTVVVLHDITELREISRQMLHQATHDSLTGLANRQAFEEELRGLLSNLHMDDAVHAVCYLDLDQFKVVNDTSGHTAGDELLCQIAMQLATQTRENDVIARLGGDEFGVLLRDTSVEEATQTAERICRCIEELRFNWKKKLFRVGVSIGLVPVTGDSGEYDQVLTDADTACYIAKANGRNRVYVHVPGSREVVSHHSDMEWIRHLSEATDHDRLLLFTQVIRPVTWRRGERVGLEFLVRMRAADGSILNPPAFLPVAERYNAMLRIDRWVLENAVRLIAECEDDTAHVEFFCVNLSAQSITDQYFVDFALEVLQRGEVDPKRLVFEITETSAVTNFSRAASFIKILRDTGCRFALDDFGGGLSSFSHLKNLPLDFIKIDGSFVRDMLTDPVNFETVRAINQVGHTMGLVTVAEYVENEEILERLRAIGIDYAQGYYINRPMPFKRWVHESLYGDEFKELDAAP